jgi:hypothetical protein
LGTAALIIFLSSLALAFLSLFTLVWGGLRIYRTLRYAQKDVQAWIELFRQRGKEMKEALEGMERRVSGIAETGSEIREKVDDIHEVVEELSRHPILGALATAPARRE